MRTDPAARRTFFNALAGEWSSASDFRANQERLANLIAAAPVGRGDHVLDVGSGTGIALPALRQAVGPQGRVVGIDTAENMVEEARKVHPAVILGDILAPPPEFPFGERDLDFILAFAVLPHLEDPAQFLKIAANLLRPNGHLLVLHFMSRAICNDFHRKAGTAVEHDMLPTRTELDEMAAKAGLVPVSFQEADDLFYWLVRRTG